MKNKPSAQSPYKSILWLLLLFCVLYYSRQKQSYTQNMKSDQTVTQETVIKEKSNNQTKSIDVHIINNITQEMLTYKHWSGSYAPTIFAITISGNPLPLSETIEAQATNGTIIIRYDYSFMNGYKAGSREIQFRLLPEKNEYYLTFSWHHPMHLILEDAAISQATVVAFNKSLESKNI